MAEEGFEEWDADFLDQLIHVEELALTCSQIPPQPPPPPQQKSYFHHPSSNDNIPISYSPPRILSQRPTTDYTAQKPLNRSSNDVFTSIPSFVHRSGDDNEAEVDKLKRELGRVSKQLSHLEQECLELRKERDKKEERLKSVFSQAEVKDVEVHSLKNSHLNYVEEHAAIFSKLNEQAGSRIDTAATTCKGIGVQTEKYGDSSHLIVNHDASSSSNLSNKLLAIWSSPSGQRSASDLVSKLFVTCSEDFHILFGCLHVNVPSARTTKIIENKNLCDFALPDYCQSIYSSEISKISHLSTVLSKISSGMIQLEALFEILLDLCSLENVVIVYRCLRILHVVLRHLLSMVSSSEKRDNVEVKGVISGNNLMDFCGSGKGKSGGLLSSSSSNLSYSGHIPLGMRLFDSEALRENEFCNYGTGMSVSCIDWVSLFKLMHQISMRHKEECVLFEAASIMTIIFFKSNAYVDREKFQETVVFESVAQTIKKEAGLRVQKQAVQLFYLSLNCPKLLLAFCSGCKDAESVDTGIAPTFKGFSSILQGLADCVASSGDGSQDLKLSRSAIIVLAFLASSGNTGFEIVLSHRLSKGSDFLVLILRLLVSEMNLKAADTTDTPERFKERTMLIREALIFLNRLVSSPVYSNAVLRVLTNSRDAASLTVDISNRLARKDQGIWQSESMIKLTRESEIIDLALAFRKRVFTYLGDKH